MVLHLVKSLAASEQHALVLGRRIIRKVSLQQGEAFEFYKEFKYKSIKDTADAALKENLINEKIYNSLLGYQIEDPSKYDLMLDDTLPYILTLKDGQKVIHEFNKVSDLLSKTGLTKTQVSNVFVGEIKKGWRLGNLSSKDVRY